MVGARYPHVSIEVGRRCNWLRLYPPCVPSKTERAGEEKSVVRDPRPRKHEVRARATGALFHSRDPGPLLSLDTLDGGPDCACDGGRPKLRRDAFLIALLPMSSLLGAASVMCSLSKGSNLSASAGTYNSI